MTITGAKLITVTGKYINFVSGAGENGTVQFIPSVPSLSDATDDQFLTVPPLVATLPGSLGGTPNSSGPGTFSIILPCTDNDELHPGGFSYTVIERVTNMANRVTKGVLIPSTLGATVDLTTVLQPYI